MPKFHLGFVLAVITAFAPIASLAQAKADTAPSKEPSVSVPFVGCKSDGQVGPQDAPTGKRHAVSIPAEAAQQLAFYQSQYGHGVLAPRGWFCFGTYGSSGSQLYVSSQPINSGDIFAENRKGFTGPAIEVGNSVGDTSGRFEVAKIMARVFPAYKNFVKKVIAEGIEPASSFPSGPYPGDKLTYKSTRVVEFETPANAEGLGTASWLLKNDSPIRGVAVLVGPEPSLVQLSVRLAPGDKALADAIIGQMERDARD